MEIIRSLSIKNCFILLFSKPMMTGLLSKKSFLLTQLSMFNFGLVVQLLVTSLLMTLKNILTLFMMMSWSMKFVGLTNGLITILPLMVRVLHLCQIWQNCWNKMDFITIGGRLLTTDIKYMLLVRKKTYKRNKDWD